MDDSIAKDRYWTIAGPLDPTWHFLVKDEDGQLYIKGEYICPMAKGSDIDTLRFYHNPYEDWPECRELIRNVRCLEDKIYTIQELYGKLTAVFYDVQQVVLNELYLLREAIQARASKK